MSDRLIAQIAGGLAGRMRSLVVALDRLDRLESGSGEWLSAFAGAELPEASAALTLRALRATAEPANFAILTALSTDESRSIDHLIEVTGIGRLVLTERLNDLVQVGLASRMIDTDHAQITAAGTNLVHLVNQIAGEVSKQYLTKATR